MPPHRTIATILPPREGFGPGRTGAVGMIARRLATVRDPLRPDLVPLVIGGAQEGALFPETPFVAARPVWLPVTPNLRYAAGVARLLRRTRPALVEVHNRADIALWLARSLSGVPVSLFVHNDPQGMRRMKTPAERARVARRLARVIGVSDWVCARFADGLPAGLTPPFALPNAIDLASIPPSPAIREPTILFVGRIVQEKAPDVFVAAAGQALRALPGWRAEMIGGNRFGAGHGDTPFIRTLRAQAEAAGVALLGYRTHEAVLEAMARAAIVVVPSRWQEPFGLTALEAMACGAALVCSPRGGLPEVGGEAALYADPDDAPAVAAAILALARDPARLAAAGAAGRQRAELFGLEPVGARLSALRRTLLAVTRGGSVAPPRTPC